MTLVTRRN